MPHQYKELPSYDITEGGIDGFQHRILVGVRYQISSTMKDMNVLNLASIDKLSKIITTSSEPHVNYLTEPEIVHTGNKKIYFFAQVYQNACQKYITDFDMGFIKDASDSPDEEKLKGIIRYIRQIVFEEVGISEEEFYTYFDFIRCNIKSPKMVKYLMFRDEN